MPYLRQASRKSSSDASAMISSRRSSFMTSSSNRPMRPLKPVLLQLSQPRPRRTSWPPPRRASGPAPSAISVLGWNSVRQSLQIFRTSRWARMASSVAVIKNGGTPMSRSRVIADGASLVCSVLKTMCPVSDAWTAISAVSRSRISPTRILSGSCRRIDRRQCGEGDADVGVDRASG